jgi:hypothetical protein
MNEMKVKKVQLSHQNQRNNNVGDKVVLLNQQQGNVYEVTYITRHGDYVIEHEAWGAIIHSGNHIELYKPPIFLTYIPI